MEDLTQKASQSSTPPPDEMDVWRDLAGMKKGRVYGLGSESTIMNKRYHGSSSSSSEWVRREEFEQLQDKNIELLTRVENNERMLHQMLEKLKPTMRTTGQAESGSELDSSEEDEGEDLGCS